MADNNQGSKNPESEKRVRFIRPVTLLLIAGVLVLALVLLFPARRFLTLSHNLEQRQDPSSVSISYLQELLRANPEDDQLRMNLARQLAAAGNIPRAREVLMPLADSGNTDTRWLYMQVTWQAFNALEEDDPQRAELRGELVKHGIAPLFIERLRNHPWRTDDPSRAVLFIVPALLDWYAARLCGKRSLPSHLDNLGREINGTYAEGRRHVVLAANWETHCPRS